MPCDNKSPAKISGLPLGIPTVDDYVVFVDLLDGITKKALIAELPIGTGTVLSVTSANPDIGVSNPTVNPVLTLNSGTSANQIVKLDGSAKLPAVDGSQLTGILTGPGSSVDNSVLRFDGTTGKTIQGSPVIIDDSGDVSGIDDIAMSGDITLNHADFNGSKVGTKLAINSSSGIISGLVLSVNADPTKFDISAGTGQIVTYTSPSSPKIRNVSFAGATAQTVTNIGTASITFILINSSGTLVQQTTPPTPAQRRDNIYVGRLNHFNLASLSFANSNGDYPQSPNSSLADLFDALGPFKINGLGLSTNGVNMKFNKAAGSMLERDYNVGTTNPHVVSVSAGNPQAFQYRTLSGAGGVVDITDIDPTNYDVGGVITAVPGAGTVSTIQRVFQFPNGNVRIQYGQNTYTNLSNAQAAIPTETFVTGTPIPGFAILIGYIVVQKNCVDLTSNRAVILNANRFDNGSGGGSMSTTTLQGAYNNSSDPEILTNSTLGAVSIRRGSAADTDNVLEIQNNAGTTTGFVRGNGIQFSQSSAESFSTTVTAAGTTVLTATSSKIQQFTGTTTQNVTLPVASTMIVGQSFLIANRSTGVVTVNSSGANLVQSMAAGSQLLVTCVLASGTTAASWDAAYSFTTVPASGFTSVALQDYQGTAVIGPLGTLVLDNARTLSEVTLTVDSIPVGSNCIIELRKNSYVSGNVLSATLQVATSDTLTNGKKSVSVSSFSSAAVADGDYLVAYVTSAGSTTPAINAVVTVRYT